VFREGGVPDTVPEVTIAVQDAESGRILLAAALARAGLCDSNSAGRRLIAGGGVRVDGERVADPLAELAPGSYLLQAGKRKSARVHVRA